MSLNIPAVPVDTQDVFAGKLDVAVSMQLKRVFEDITVCSKCEILSGSVDTKRTATLKFTTT